MGIDFLKQKLGTAIASAATITIPVDGDWFEVSGTTGITNPFVLSGRLAGQRFYLRFAGAVAITHDGTNLPLSAAGGASYTTAVGDVLLWEVFGTNQARLIAIFRATQTILAANLPSAIDAAKIADGSVSNAEFQYLNGVTSNIQDQLDSAAGGADGIGVLELDVSGSSDVNLTAEQEANGIWIFTGLLTDDISVICSTQERLMHVWNLTTGAFILTVKTAAGTGVAPSQGASFRQYMACDGTNVTAGIQASDIPNHSAAVITGGTMATARLGSGTANATTFLRGDQTWATPTGGNSFTGVKGYFAGGDAGAPSAITDKLDFAAKITYAQPSANLTNASSGVAGVSNGTTKGYACGGTHPTSGSGYRSAADRIDYNTDVASAIGSARLSTAGGRGRVCGLSKPGTAGYVAGGNTGSITDLIDKLTFSTEVTAALGGAMSSVRQFPAGCSGNSTKGYIVGGAAPSAVIDIFTYGTDTAAASGSPLAVARGYIGACSNGSTLGFVFGGTADNGSTCVSTIDKITYSTDVRSAAGDSLDANTYGAICISSGATLGYVAGGYDPGYRADAHEFTYGTELIAALTTANLTVARMLSAGISDCGY